MSTQTKHHLIKHYQDEIAPALIKEFNFSNVMMVPKLEKITLNIGCKSSDKKKINEAVEELTKIAGQKAVITYTRKSEAGFKIREGWPIGCKVTLRGDRMYAFMEKLVGLVLPRVRDFMGLKARSFDGRGNYSFGLSEQIIFPEIDYEMVSELRGMDVTITTSASEDKHALSLLKLFGFPIKGEVK